MGKALIIVVIVAVTVYALFDLIATPKDQVRWLPKPVWFAVLLFVFIGPLIWIFAGAKRNRKPPPPPPPSRYRRPPPARGPDDDPDYLRGL